MTKQKLLKELAMLSMVAEDCYRDGDIQTQRNCHQKIEELRELYKELLDGKDD